MIDYCIFLYSHSDCSDVWDLTFGQLYKHINIDDVSVIFCVDRLNGYKIDDRIKVVYYDNCQPYSERVLHHLAQIKHNYILFLHEDWVITDKFSNEYNLKLIEFMNNNDISHIRSYKAYGSSRTGSNIFHANDVNISNIPSDAVNFVSLQPGLSEKGCLIDLYSIKSDKPCVVETNGNLRSNIRIKYAKRFFYETDIKLSEDSKMFPHVHAVARGRWVLSIDTLKSLLEEYSIDKNVRGFHSCK